MWRPKQNEEITKGKPYCDDMRKVTDIKQNDNDLLNCYIS